VDPRTPRFIPNGKIEAIEIRLRDFNGKIEAIEIRLRDFWEVRLDTRTRG